MPSSPVDGPSTSVHLKALGVPIGLRLRGDLADALAEAIRDAWSWCLIDGPPSTREADIDVFVDSRPDMLRAARKAGVQLVDGRIAWLMSHLSTEITQHAVEARRGGLLMLHACAVAEPTSGATVALVGASGAGKTTAAHAMAQRFGYVTDEAIGITRETRVIPYPKPLSIIGRHGPRIKEQVSPDALNLRRAPTSLELRALALLNRREPGTVSEPTVEKLDLLEAMAQISPQSFYLREVQDPLRTLAGLLERIGGAVRVTYSDVDQLASLVSGLAVGSSDRA